VGGTKGNKILEYVSGAPNKATVLEEPPNPLDYDELTKYGYGHLVTRIMNAGGRLAMYDLLGLDTPVVKPKRSKVVTAPPLVIDRTGESDPAVYQGLRLGQVLDDQQQAQALQQVQQQIARGERPSASKVREQVESFEQPFADKRNTGPKQTPDWTVEQLDEWGRKQGRVEAWYVQKFMNCRRTCGPFHSTMHFTYCSTLIIVYALFSHLPGRARPKKEPLFGILQNRPTL